ncbi:phage portal protein [Oceanobacter sp. 3_MG-2023]|uniref:phage portal protein n=1 Tax=Oceanobacter sp. 3_MG-2023 TaxID=3062622 RepID=UPI0027358862|nr:phage portal protein [Oceanobacter sp. 3_MG-2023]MDP2505392.1 phage portal protein [Oceanobacter sp. 3_MG-2023]
MWPFKSKTAHLEQQLQATQAQLADIQNAVTVTSGDVESMMDMFQVSGSASGEPVTRDSAMKVSTVYACVRLLSGTIASLPGHVYERNGQNKDLAKNHPAQKLLHDEPNAMITSVVFWECVLNHMLLDGNHYSLIRRNRNGQVLELIPLAPWRVEPDDVNGRLQYAVVFDDGSYQVFDQDDILHIPNIGWNGKKGLSALRSVMLNSVGGALAADRYSASFFANDATPRGYIRFDQPLKESQAEVIRKYWFDHHQNPDKRHLPAFIPQGGEFKEITMSAEDAQLLQTRSFQVADIARIFGVPPHLVGHIEKSTSWGSGIEQQNLGLLIYTVRVLLYKIEQEVNRKVIRSDRYFFRFNIDGLLRGDIKTRYEAYKTALGGNQMPGFFTINEVRELEDMAPVDGGDVLYKPVTAGDSSSTGQTSSDGTTETEPTPAPRPTW